MTVSTSPRSTPPGPPAPQAPVPQPAAPRPAESSTRTDLPRVLSYPPRHPYVDRLDGHAAVLVHTDQPMPLLPDLYDPAWVHEHRRDWHVAHLHFGHEQHPLDRVVDVVAAHRDAGTPVVMTVHDLENPHLAADDPRATDLLRALAPDLAQLITLTPGCADAVADLTGRRPQIVPHGPLVPANRRRRLRAHRRRQVTAGHALVLAGGVRPNLGLEELAEACGRNRPAMPLRIMVRHEAVDREAARLDAVCDVPGVEVSAHHRLSDALLERTIADAAVLVLPYRWGTHSGLLEVAADVGTPVLHTDVGFLGEQVCTRAGRPVPVADGRIAVDALVDALGTLQPLASPVPSAQRDEAAARLVDAHHRLYRRLAAKVVR